MARHHLPLMPLNRHLRHGTARSPANGLKQTSMAWHHLPLIAGTVLSPSIGIHLRHGTISRLTLNHLTVPVTRETMPFFSSCTLLLPTAFISATCCWVFVFLCFLGHRRTTCPLPPHLKQRMDCLGALTGAALGACFCPSTKLWSGYLLCQALDGCHCLGQSLL